MFKLIKNNLSLIAVSWGHFVNDFYMSVIPVVLYAFAIEMKLTAFQMSFIAFAITTAGTFFQPLVGLLIDRIQKSVLLIYALVLISIGMSISGLITNYYLLVLTVAIAALGSSIYHPLGSTITIHKTSLTRGKSLSVFMTVGSFAHSAAPVIAIPLVTVYGLKGLSLLLIPGLLSALFLYLVRVQDVTWTKEEAKDKSLHGKLTLKQQILISIPMCIAVMKGLIYRSVVVFGVIILGIKGVEPVAAGAILSVFMVARAVATLVGGFVSDSIGERNTLRLFNTIGFFAIALLVYGNLALSIIGLIILGFTLNGTASANITIVHHIMPNNINYGTGLIMGFAATISAVVMLAYGYVVDMFGHAASLNVLVVAAGIMAFISYLIPVSLNNKLSNSVETVKS